MWEMMKGVLPVRPKGVEYGGLVSAGALGSVDVHSRACIRIRNIRRGHYSNAYFQRIRLS